MFNFQYFVLVNFKLVTFVRILCAADHSLHHTNHMYVNVGFFMGFVILLSFSFGESISVAG